MAALLQCSGRWAEKLTEAARSSARAQRDAEIIRLKDAGLSNREVGRETGYSKDTVRRVVDGAISHSAEPRQPTDDPPAWVEKLRDLESPEARAWSSALAALRLINEQVSMERAVRPLRPCVTAGRFVGVSISACRCTSCASARDNQ